MTQRACVCQLRICPRGVSPMMSRRLPVRSDASLVELHQPLQAALGWTDSYLHRFRIHGKNYRDGGSRSTTSPLPSTGPLLEPSVTDESTVLRQRSRGGA